jgi:DNA-binding protein YbaB
VRVEVTGGMEFRSVTIRPDAVDPDDVEMLQDLVLAAINEAVGKVTAAQQDALGGLGGMLGGGGGLGGLLG